jgi:transcriptional regulator with XRE-family HTH domain
MAQRCFKQLTSSDRLMISKLKAKKLSLSEIARRIGKDKSTVSRELRRNAVTVTPQDRFFLLRVNRLWSEEQLDEYLLTEPAESRQTNDVWLEPAADRWQVENRWARARQPRVRLRALAA